MLARPWDFRCLALPTLGYLVSCSGVHGGAAPRKGEDTGVPETGGPDEGGGEDSASPPRYITIRLRDIPVGAPELAVSLVPLSFGTLDGLPERGAAMVTETVVAGEVSLELPESPPELHIGGLARAWPEVQGALYAVVAFPAAEATSWRDGVPVAGLNFSRWLMWRAPGEAPDGWPEGWSWVDSGMGGMHAPNRCLADTTEPLLWREAAGYPLFYPVEEGLDLALRGLPVSLSVVAEGAEGSARVALVPHQRILGEEPDLSVFLDEPLAEGRWEVTLNDGPPTEHDLSSDLDWRHTLSWALPYQDGDGDGAWSEADGRQAEGLCVGGHLAGLRYARTVSSWRGARFLDCYGAQVGWSLVQFDESWESWVTLDPTLAGAAHFVADCAP